MLSTPDPPFRDGRYHRAGGRATWYGASTEADAWAELRRALPDGADPGQFPRRIGRVGFELVALDLTSRDLQKRLKIGERDLTADDLSVCQTLADLATDVGFEAVIGPSAAVPGESTIAIFGGAITSKARDVLDLGVRSAQ